MRLHSLDIPVLDLDRAVGFYTRVLGFPLVTRGRTSAILFIGDVHGGMVTLAVAEPGEVGHGATIVFFAEEGVPEARAALEARGVTFLAPTATGGLGPAAHFLDSEGNRLAIRQPTLTARIREDGARPLDDIRATLRASANRASAVLDTMSEAQGRHIPAPGEWPVVDQVGHMIDSLDSGLAISAALAAGRKADEGGLWSASYPAASVASAVADLRRAFAAFDDALSDFPPGPNLEARLVHGVFGPLNCLDWLAFTSFHVGMHVDQVEAITRKDGLPTG